MSDPLPEPALPAFDQDGWDGQLWMGWMSGFEVITRELGAPALWHRCGWWRLISVPLLGNVIMTALGHVRDGCLHREPDPNGYSALFRARFHESLEVGPEGS